MADFDDLERLRLAPEPRANRPRTASGPAVFVGRVTTSEPEVGKFLLVRPVRIFGAAGPGSAAEPEDIGEASVPAYLVGPGTPTTGDRLIVRHVPDRWAAGFRETGDQPPVVVQAPGCACATAPAVLNMTVTYGPGKTSADYFDTVKSAVLTWQPQPSYCVGLDTRYYSPLIPAPGQGGNIFYSMSCSAATGGVYFLATGTDIFGPSIPFSSFAGDPLSCSPFLIPEMLATQLGSPEFSFIADGGTMVIS